MIEVRIMEILIVVILLSIVFIARRRRYTNRRAHWSRYTDRRAHRRGHSHLLEVAKLLIWNVSRRSHRHLRGYPWRRHRFWWGYSEPRSYLVCRPLCLLLNRSSNYVLDRLTIAIFKCVPIYFFLFDLFPVLRFLFANNIPFIYSICLFFLDALETNSFYFLFDYWLWRHLLLFSRSFRFLFHPESKRSATQPNILLIWIRCSVRLIFTNWLARLICLLIEFFFSQYNWFAFLSLVRLLSH
jgi:hypothetical protein